jgi:serine/threonine protein kinase/Tol biopolymer transport system component
LSLTPGTRIGGYEIHSALGAGGMGEVYRARDVRLGRDVAIKVVPAAFTIDPDRLARFEREARVLASLNHPNIAGIYGVEEVAVAGTRAPSHALVLELIEGETLAFRILGGLTLRESLDIARQIAEALDAAHERGIIHRDLKPGNVMVTAAGVAKVLDFGLAKTADTAAQANLSQSPTVTFGATAHGVLLGTAPYMSPEQARGFVVDKRCDVWAFGCVLFEMLTAQRAFEGPTLTDTIAAVIEREPDWSKLPASTPPSVRQLLRRCLAKKPARRMRDAGDIALEIESAIASLDHAEPAPSNSTRRPVFKIAVASVLLLTVGVAGGLLARREAVAPASSINAGVMTRITSDGGLTIEPSISADGRLVAYASNRDGNLDVYVQQIGGGASIRLTSDPADDREPDVSPDGSVVAFRSERSARGVYVAAALGGGARLIARDGMAPRFSPDGRRIAFWMGPWLAPRSVNAVRQTFIVPSEGGTPVQVAKELASVGDPVWSPGGRALLVYGRKAIDGPNTDPDWWWVPIDGGAPTATRAWETLRTHQFRVNNTDTHPYPRAWTTDGQVVFTAQLTNADNRGLWRLAIDERTGLVTGVPEPLTNGPTQDVWASASRNGRMVFAAENSTELGFEMPFDGNAGRALGPLQRIRRDSTPTGRSSISEDGRLLAFPKYEFAAGSLWVRDLRTGEERQLAATPRTPLNPVLSVDGRMVGYTVTSNETGGAGGPGTGFVVETSGGVPRRICDDCQVDLFTRDNQQVIFADPSRSTLFRMDIRTGVRTPFITSSRGPVDRPMISPNGAWLTFNAPGGVYLAPVHSDRAPTDAEWTRILETTSAGRTAGMSPDGSLLYLLLERDGFRCLYSLKLDPATGQPRSEPSVVTHFHDEARRWGTTGLGSAVAANRFVASLYETTGNIWMTTIGPSTEAK